MSEALTNDWLRQIDWLAKSHVRRVTTQAAEEDLREFSDEDRQAIREQYLKDLKHLYWTDKIQKMPNIVVLHDRSRDDITELVIKRGHTPSSLRSFTDLGDTPNPHNENLEAAAAEADHLYIVGDYIDSPDSLRAQAALRPDVKARFISASINIMDTLDNRQVQNFEPNQELL